MINISQPLGHISTRYVDLLNRLGIIVDDYDYTVMIPEEDAQTARNFIRKITTKKLFPLFLMEVLVSVFSLQHKLKPLPIT